MLTPRLCRTARTLVDLSQAELAARAGVNPRTLMDFEREARSPVPSTLKAIRLALEEMGVEFLNGDEPGVKLRKRSSMPS